MNRVADVGLQLACAMMLPLTVERKAVENKNMKKL